MTLLESLVALVVFGLAAVGLLEVLQGSSRSVRRVEGWVEAVARAEALMEASKLGTGVGAAPGGLPGPGEGDLVTARPWPEQAGVELVTVTVRLAGGGSFTLHRLAPAR